MPNIRILDEKLYPLDVKNYTNNTNNTRWSHRATLAYSGRRFIVFVDNGIKNDTGQYIVNPEAYIEEISSGHLEYIDNEDLFLELKTFADNHNLLNFIGFFK